MKGSDIVKKISIICLAVMLVLSGCTPKSQLYNTAMDILERVEAGCSEIASDVEMLGDDYTTGVFENIIESAKEYRAFLSGKPSSKEIELTITSLSRLEKELGSVKILSAGMDDYIPELTFEFKNNTSKAVEKIVLITDDGQETEAFSGVLSPDTQMTIAYPIDDGAWSVTAHIENGDTVTGEGIVFTSINALVLNELDGSYEFTTE